MGRLTGSGIAMMPRIVSTSFLIRIYPRNILEHDGLLNETLPALHILSVPVVWLCIERAMYPAFA
jgi:putrescine transport system permease protein